MHRSDHSQPAYHAQIQFPATGRWVTLGVEETRARAEAGLRALVGSWERTGRPSPLTRVVNDFGTPAG